MTAGKCRSEHVINDRTIPFDRAGKWPEIANRILGGKDQDPRPEVDSGITCLTMGGRLYLDGVTLAHCEEAVIGIFVERVGHRKARAEPEMFGIVAESANGLPGIRVWVHEGLEEAARRLHTADS